jgi:hypothetical protein
MCRARLVDKRVRLSGRQHDFMISHDCVLFAPFCSADCWSSLIPYLANPERNAAAQALSLVLRHTWGSCFFFLLFFSFSLALRADREITEYGVQVLRFALFILFAWAGRGCFLLSPPLFDLFFFFLFPFHPPSRFSVDAPGFSVS